jgi:hypothetical protein
MDSLSGLFRPKKKATAKASIEMVPINVKKTDFLNSLFDVDWSHVDLEHLDTLFNSHGVQYRDLANLMAHHYAQVKNIKKIRCNKFTHFKIRESNGSLRAVIFIVFKYCPNIGDIVINSERLRLKLFNRSRALSRDRFIGMCETATIEEIMSYKSQHCLYITDDEIIAFIKNPHGEVFETLLCEHREAMEKIVSNKMCNRFGDIVDARYIIAHAHDGLAGNLMASLNLELDFDLMACAFDGGKSVTANCILRSLIASGYFIDNYGTKGQTMYFYTLDPKTMHDLDQELKFNGKIWRNTILSAYRYNDLCGVEFFTVMGHHHGVETGMMLLNLIFNDAHLPTYGVTKGTYEKNRAILYKWILHSFTKEWDIELVMKILNELKDENLTMYIGHKLGVYQIKCYNGLPVNVIFENFASPTVHWQSVNSAIIARYTKDNFNIDRLLLECESCEDALIVLKILEIKLEDFNEKNLLSRINSIVTKDEFYKFALLVEYVISLHGKKSSNCIEQYEYLESEPTQKVCNWLFTSCHYKMKFDKLHAEILRACPNEEVIRRQFYMHGITFMRRYNLALLDIIEDFHDMHTYNLIYDFIKKAIRAHRYTKNDFIINDMLFRLSIHQAYDIIVELDIKNYDFDVGVLFEKEELQQTCALEFGELLDHLESSQPIDAAPLIDL